jgi:zinc protease
MLLPKHFYQGSVFEQKKEGKQEDREKSATLDNGLRIFVKERTRLPLVSATLVMPGGLRAENAETNGISNLMMNSMLKGTRRRKESEIVPDLERMGGGIKAFSGANSMGIVISLVSQDLSKGMDIFEDVVKNASFPKDEISKQKKKIIAAIKEQEKNIFDTGLLEFRKELYGTHPYGLRSIGEVKTVETFTRDDVEDFSRKYWGPEGAVLAVVGDVDADEVLNDMTKRFSGWKGGREKIKNEKVSPPDRQKREEITMRKEQSLFVIGFLGAEATEEKRYVLRVISSLLSGADGFLFYVLREKEGLAYSSGAVSIPAVDPGYFVIYAATAEENITATKEKVLELIKKIRSGDLSEEDLEAAKSRIITQYAGGNEKNSSFSMAMALDELYGLGYDNYKVYPQKIRAVTLRDVKDTAKEVMDISRSATVIIHSE